MLGLGSSITRGSVRVPIVNYTSDFSSDANGWVAYSVEDSASDLTLAANANPYTDNGGSAPNSAGWLKCTYGVNQTNESGIELDISGSPISVDLNESDVTTVTGDMYIHSGSNWDSFSSTIQLRCHIPGYNSSTGNATPGSVYSFDITKTNNHGGDDVRLTFHQTAQLPQDGAVIYFKNITITVFR